MKKLFSKTVVCLLLIFPLSIIAQERRALKKAEKFELPKIEGAKFDKVFPGPPKNYKYPRIKRFDAVLELISSQVEFKAGTDPEVTFRLMNLDLKKLVIREWFMVESNNIIIYYTPWERGEKVPTFDKWKELKPDVGKDPKRIPLDLKHRNSVLINTSLRFVKDMKIRTPHGFLIIAKLNLSSIPIRSLMIPIRVNP